MNHQRGFLPITGYIGLAALAAFLAMSASIYWYKSRYEAVKQEYATFQATVKAQGELAAKEAARINADNLKRKESADAAHKKLLTANADLARSLRDERARRGVLSGVSSPANRPNLVCFGRAEYERAFGQFDKELSGIAQECDERTVNLNSARKWLLDVVK